MNPDMRLAWRAFTGDRYAPGLRASLAVVGIIVLFALIGLAAAGNWSKVLRVATAALTYVVVLLATSRGTASLRFGAFVAAGAAAGAVSGLARPSVSGGLVLASVAGAALLLAPLHWGALRTRSRILRRIPPAPAFRPSRTERGE